MINKIVNIPEFLWMKEQDKAMIWSFRYSLVDNGKALVKFLQSANLHDEKEQKEAMQLFNNWSQMKMEDALPLLSAKFAANSIYREDIADD